MLTFPNSKINIGLRIIQKRPDGFHNLESVFYPIGWSDILEISDAASLQSSVQFTTSGLPISGDPATNLCLKAYHLLQQQFSLPPVNIHLHKVIPMGAGLGGGSSDAAFTLKLLNAKFKLNLTVNQLLTYAAQLGSDCAFFISNKPAFATSKGEVLQPSGINLDQKQLVVVAPNLHSNTAQAYAHIVPKPAPSNWQTILLHQPINEWAVTVHNDFEAGLIQRFPEIAQIKAKLYQLGAAFSAMTGSGTAVYGIFDTPLAANIKSHFENCTVWQETLDQQKLDHQVFSPTINASDSPTN